MNNIKFNNKLFRVNIGLGMALLLTLFSCNKLVDAGPPREQTVADIVFSSDASATSAVYGIYTTMINTISLFIGSGAVTVYGGLSSDELSYTGTNATLQEINTNEISKDNLNMTSNLWQKAYDLIYKANICIEGITKSNSISSKIKNQLLGECLIVRSHIYFNMIQLFGDVPLILTTDYKLNASMARTPSNQILDQLVIDLTNAASRLTPDYPTTGKIRPNQLTANALLAKVYLLQKKWDLAEIAATTVIDSKKYILESNLDNIFLIQSDETIWQVMPVNVNINTPEGSNLIPSSTTAKPNYIFTQSLLNAFENGDNRKASWVKVRTVATIPYATPNKYKTRSATPWNEYYVIFRLAEQYLIRAEARNEQNKVADAVKDINIIRNRARGPLPTDLPPLSETIAKEDLAQAIIRERRIELLCEWGNRWFDLKRYHLANNVLSSLKSAWQPTDTLYPIPADQLILNKNLEQNAGYPK